VTTARLPRAYTDLAAWFHLLTAPEDYAEEAEQYRKAIVSACQTPPRSVLELGSGGGNNASHLKAHFEMTLTDLSPQMLAVSKAINPELKHIEGDMRTLRLGRDFDAVFVHDAVAYMTTEADLAAAMETAFLHCKPGGAALFIPDALVETFEARTHHGGHDAPDGRGLRYLEWTWDPVPDDGMCTVDFAFLLREADGAAHAVHDRHLEGLFSRETWLRLLREAGFTDPRSEPLRLSDVDDGLYEMFIARKP
jgi:SAM-dependent methyltransferase